jgi:hypothetical protein
MLPYSVYGKPRYNAHCPYHHLLTIRIRFSGLIETKHHTGFTAAKQIVFSSTSLSDQASKYWLPANNSRGNPYAPITQNGNIKLINDL